MAVNQIEIVLESSWLREKVTQLTSNAHAPGDRKLTLAPKIGDNCSTLA
jgi:hypothetical protein